MYPPYGAPYHPYPPPRQTNTMAVAALIGGIVFAPLGIVFGHISLSQIKRTGEDGRGMALAGLIIGYVFTAIAIVSIVGFVVLAALMVEVSRRLPPYPTPTVTAGPTHKQLPAFNPPADLGANCSYPPTTEPASKQAKPPRSGRVPTQPARVSASISTNQGNIGVQLDNAKSPCTVNNFASLAQQGYFDHTACHRLTTGPTMGLLQCGDPTGTGSGGPGYRFANEYPTNQYRLSDPALHDPVIYPRGTLAMANSGSGTNGSQFFIVYADASLPPTYTVFGTIDAIGLATVDKVSEGGVEGGGDDGKPATKVTITSVRLD